MTRLCPSSLGGRARRITAAARGEAVFAAGFWHGRWLRPGQASSL